MDESTWVAAMRDKPQCLLTLGAFADWLQEQNDPRWEAAAFLYENREVGDLLAVEDTAWRRAVHSHLTYITGANLSFYFASPEVATRMFFLNVYAAATADGRAYYLDDYRKVRGFATEAAA
jgi:uncharacterized protein (TIGR02996 family)